MIEQKRDERNARSAAGHHTTAVGEKACMPIDDVWVGSGESIPRRGGWRRLLKAKQTGVIYGLTIMRLSVVWCRQCRGEAILGRQGVAGGTTTHLSKCDTHLTQP